jgi:uncharacterized membrane protein
VKQLFWTGLVILLPVVVTIWFAKLLFIALAAPFGELAILLLSSIPSISDQLPSWSGPCIAQTLSVLFLILVIFLIGLVGRWVLVHWLIHFSEHVVARIPFVNKVYKACKDFTHILFSENTSSFSKVVIVHFPSENQQAVGLLTNTIETDVITGTSEKYCTVLLPGTPNPTVGFLLFMPASTVIHTDAKVDEAVKFIMSCGTASRGMSSL